MPIHENNPNVLNSSKYFKNIIVLRLDFVIIIKCYDCNCLPISLNCKIRKNLRTSSLNCVLIASYDISIYFSTLNIHGLLYILIPKIEISTAAISLAK